MKTVLAGIWHALSAGRQWMLGGLALANALRADAQTALNVTSLPGYPGAHVSLPVSSVRATNVAAAQFDVAYNPVKVSLGEIVPEAVFSNHMVWSREVAPGVRRVLVYSRENATVTVTNSRPVATLPFIVSPMEYVGSGPIGPLNAVLARPDATAIAPVTLDAGTIFVRPVNLQQDGAQFFLPSEPGTNYVIQATTDFVDWTDISTNTAFGTFLDLFDSAATNYPHRFYRSVR